MFTVVKLVIAVCREIAEFFTKLSIAILEVLPDLTDFCGSVSGGFGKGPASGKGTWDMCVTYDHQSREKMSFFSLGTSWSLGLDVKSLKSMGFGERPSMGAGIGISWGLAWNIKRRKSPHKLMPLADHKLMRGGRDTHPTPGYGMELGVGGSMNVIQFIPFGIGFFLAQTGMLKLEVDMSIGFTCAADSMSAAFTLNCNKEAYGMSLGGGISASIDLPGPNWAKKTPGMPVDLSLDLSGHQTLHCYGGMPGGKPDCPEADRGTCVDKIEKWIPVPPRSVRSSELRKTRINNGKHEVRYIVCKKMGDRKCHQSKMCMPKDKGCHTDFISYLGKVNNNPATIVPFVGTFTILQALAWELIKWLDPQRDQSLCDSTTQEKIRANIASSTFLQTAATDRNGNGTSRFKKVMEWRRQMRDQNGSKYEFYTGSLFHDTVRSMHGDSSDFTKEHSLGERPSFIQLLEDMKHNEPGCPAGQGASKCKLTNGDCAPPMHFEGCGSNAKSHKTCAGGCCPTTTSFDAAPEQKKLWNCDKVRLRLLLRHAQTTEITDTYTSHFVLFLFL